MKSPTPLTRKAPSLPAALAIATALLAFTANPAAARFTYDMRAIGVDSPLATVFDAKHVGGLTPNTTVTFAIWVQITSASGAGVFGYQNSVFSILSSNGGGILGNVGLFQPIAPWNSNSVGGTITASLDGDSDLDNGTNLTNTLTGLPKARSNNTAGGGGDPSFANAQTTNVHLPSAQFQPVTVGGESGFEVEIGTVEFIMSSYGATDPAVPIGINVRPATNLIGVQKTASAFFIESSIARNGTTGVFAVGADVALSASPVPEPSAFGLVLLGALGLAGLCRAELRRA